MNIKRKILIAMSVIMIFTVGCKKQKDDVNDPSENEIEEEDIDSEKETDEEETEEEDEDGEIDDDDDDEEDTEDVKDKIDKNDDEIANNDNTSKDEPIKPNKPSKPNQKEPVKDKPNRPNKPSKPSKPAPGKENKPVVSKSKIKEAHSAVKKSLGEGYTPDMGMPQEQLGNLLSVPVSNLGGFIAEIPMMSMHVDTFIAIDAKNNVKAVENDLKKYRNSLVDGTMQYPMNMAKVKASKVITIKNDVYFIMLGAFDDRDNVSEEEQLNFAKQEVEKVEKVIRSQY